MRVQFFFSQTQTVLWVYHQPHLVPISSLLPDCVWSSEGGFSEGAVELLAVEGTRYQAT